METRYVVVEKELSRRREKPAVRQRGMHRMINVGDVSDEKKIAPAFLSFIQRRIPVRCLWDGERVEMGGF